MATANAEILSQIDYLHISRNSVLLQESLALTVAETEKYNVNLIKRHLVRKLQFCLAD